MLEKGFTLGGEQSGHTLFLDAGPTGDGIMTALQTLKAVQQSGKSLLEWRGDMPLFPQTLVNVRVADKHGISQHEDVRQAVLEVEQQLEGRGRINLRPSGTESLVRVMIEGPSEAIIKELAESVASVIRRVGGAS